MPRLLIRFCLVFLAGCGVAPAAPTATTAPTATAVPAPTTAPTTTTAAVPTAAPTPNLQATVAAAVAATQTAQPTATTAPTATMAPVPTTAPTPNLQATVAAAVAATQAAQPTATLIPPTATPAPAAVPKQVAAELVSGGLGLTQAEWEARHGMPTGTDVLSYEGGRYLVIFYEGRVWHLTRTWGEQSPTALEDASSTGKFLLPQDAALVRTYTASEDRRVEVYHSEALAAVFPPKAFGVTEGAADAADADATVKVGDCIVIYKRTAAGRVHTIIVAAGNNP